MDEPLRKVHEHMLKLGLCALSHANTHANFHTFDNDKWDELSVIQAGHAAEILIKARIAKEHPLLIFKNISQISSTSSLLNLEQIVRDGKTYSYNELPDLLWATTGVTIKNKEIYKEFGFLRNSIQHFIAPINENFSKRVDEFIYGVIDPFINECWGLYAVDYHEDSEPYIYFIPNLVSNEIEFLVSPEVLDCTQDMEFCWSENHDYNKIMKKRLGLPTAT